MWYQREITEYFIEEDDYVKRRKELNLNIRIEIVQYGYDYCRNIHWIEYIEY